MFTDKRGREFIAYGSAYINGRRLVYNPYTFKKGKKKGKVQCYYRKGSIAKKIILDPEDITPLEKEDCQTK